MPVMASACTDVREPAADEENVIVNTFFLWYRKRLPVYVMESV